MNSIKYKGQKWFLGLYKNLMIKKKLNEKSLLSGTFYFYQKIT